MNTSSLSILDDRHYDAYSKEAPYYDINRFALQRGRLYNHFELAAIVRLLEPLEGRQVLDVASGTGRVALTLAAQGAVVTGVDLTPEMIQIARHKAVNAKLTDLSWITAKGQQLPFAAGTFDIVTCVRFLHLLSPHLWNPFVEEMRRVVRPEGLVMVELFNPLYGGPLAMLREFFRGVKGEPREHFVWPHKLRKALTGLEIVSVTSFWLPGMGLVAEENSIFFDLISRACTRRPLTWIAGPHLVLAHPRL